jgi:2-amino-4-hydroxy-6-hydroxymethyldihydropteridine diphosphokinase
MDVVVGLGSNVGDRLGALAAAARALRDVLGGTVASSLYETSPVGPPQPDYLNAALRGTFGDSPDALLGLLLGVERRAGRERRERFGPRVLDVDVLWIDGVARNSANLVVPHPRLAERRFALEPLLDVAPDARDPATGVLLRTWLDHLPSGGIQRIGGPEWAIAAV